MNKKYEHISGVNSARPIPKAGGLPLIGQSMKAVRDPLQVLRELSLKYSDVVKLRLGLKDFYVLQSADAAKHVLQTNARNYYKPGAAKLMKRVLGNGLATSNGDLWQHQRKLIQPAFHKQALAHFYTILNAEIENLIKTWKKDQSARRINVGQSFLSLTLNNLTKAMFGVSVEKEMQEIEKVLDIMLRFSSKHSKSLIKLPLFLPTPGNRRFLAAEQKFNKIIYDIIAQREREQLTSPLANRKDLLEILLTASDVESNPVIAAKQLRDEITTIFMAGHETTSQTLSWIFYHMAAQPELYQKVKDEVSAISPDNIFQSLPSLAFTRSLIEETMRFYPPVWIMARKALSGDEINGYEIPAGATLLINVYGLHHHPVYWQNPEKFYPERFREPNNGQQSLWQYLPFGGGQRICIGRHFAMMVMQTVLVRLVQEFSFDIPEGFSPTIDANLVLRSRESIQLIVQSNTTYAEQAITTA